MDTPTRSPLLRLHPADNVLVTRAPLALGQALPEFGLRMRAQVPAGHKIAAQRIAAGERVRKYNVVIGAATRDIEAGEHVHSHNLGLGEGILDDYRDPAFSADVRTVAYVPEAQRATFMGIKRADGRVAGDACVQVCPSQSHVSCIGLPLCPPKTSVDRLSGSYTIAWACRPPGRLLCTRWIQSEPFHSQVSPRPTVPE